MIIRDYAAPDVVAMTGIWNEVVEAGVAFPQVEPLDERTAPTFFASQSATRVAVDESGGVAGLYILHPNNVGRVGHIANASYAVAAERRGQHIGEALVKDSLHTACAAGFRILQFNAVVDSNVHALHLYKRLGFVDLGVIPAGFCTKDGTYEAIHVMYRDLLA